MTKTEPAAAIPKVYAAVRNCIADLAAVGIGKNQRNPDQGFMYRGIDDVYDALGKILATNHLLILPTVASRVTDERPVEQRLTRSKTVMHHLVLTVDYRFVCAEDGSEFSVTFQGESLDMGDKGTSKALSMAYKYMALEVFCIPLEGMSDGDAVTAPEAALADAPPPPAPKVEQPRPTRPSKTTPQARPKDDDVIEEYVTDSEIQTLRAGIQDADDKGDDETLTRIGRRLLPLAFKDEKVKAEIATDLAVARSAHITAETVEGYTKMLKVFHANKWLSKKDYDALLTDAASHVTE